MRTQLTAPTELTPVIETEGEFLDDLNDPPCDTPDGRHRFRTSCGETKCPHCGLVAWF
jgi:hypothetical protein